MLVAFERHSRSLLVLAIASATAGSIAIALRSGPRASDRVSTCGVSRASYPAWLVGAPLHRIAGRVHGHTRGLTVALRAVAGGGTAWEGAAVAVRGDGLFDFGPMPAGEYELLALRDGRPASEVALVRTDRDAYNAWQDGDEVEIFAPGCRSREVLVTDIAEAPIAGASISVGGVRAWTTDARGVAHACLVLDDAAALVVRARGYMTGHAFLFADTDTRLHVRLLAAVETGATITDRNGEPVDGALVELGAVDGGPDVVDAAVTSSDGTFAIPLARDRGPYRVTVRLGATSWEAGEIFAGARGATLVVRGEGIEERDAVELGRVIRGRVTCHGNGVPFARIEHGDEVTHARADGSFALVVREPWPRSLSVGPALMAVEAVALPAGGDRVVDGMNVISCARGE